MLRSGTVCTLSMARGLTPAYLRLAGRHSNQLRFQRALFPDEQRDNYTITGTLWPYVNQHLKQRRCIATILWQFTSHLTVYHTSESHRDHVSTKDNTEMDTVCAPFTQKQKNCNWYLFFTNLINITIFVLEFGGALRFWCWNKKYYSSILIFLLPNPS